MDSKKITVTVELPVMYKALISGDNVVVLDAYIAKTCFPLMVLPEVQREKVLNAICTQVRIEDFESRGVIGEDILP